MRTVYIVILLLFSAKGFSQSTEVKLPWDENKKLEWRDFQGKPDNSVVFHANTNSGILFSWSLKTSGNASEFIYDVSSSFYPLRSWVKGKQGSPELLAHEQLHFDISELFARKLREQLSTYSLTPSVKKDLNRIYEQNEKGRQRMQEEYDRESDHGLKKEAQAKWQEFVRLELEKLENLPV